MNSFLSDLLCVPAKSGGEEDFAASLTQPIDIFLLFLDQRDDLTLPFALLVFHLMDIL